MSFAASKHQRMKVAGRTCINCGQPGVDPAHLTSRAKSGCNEPLCVVPLCRRCHDRFDSARDLDLLPVLERYWKPELAHAVEHVGLLSTLERVTNTRWRPE